MIVRLLLALGTFVIARFFALWHCTFKVVTLGSQTCFVFSLKQTRKTAETDSTANGYWTREKPRKDPVNPDRETTETTDETDPRMTRPPHRRLQHQPEDLDRLIFFFWLGLLLGFFMEHVLMMIQIGTNDQHDYKNIWTLSLKNISSTCEALWLIVVPFRSKIFF